LFVCYLHQRGSVNVTPKDRSKVYATLGPGSYVGESCLLEVSARTASVYAVGYVDAYVLVTDSFLKVKSFNLFYFKIFV
jgi:CRP-like cAMP-binding protein